MLLAHARFDVVVPSCQRFEVDQSEYEIRQDQRHGESHRDSDGLWSDRHVSEPRLEPTCDASALAGYSTFGTLYGVPFMVDTRIYYQGRAWSDG